MNICKRAGHYVFRKKGKSMLLCLIIVVISTLALCGLAAMDAETAKSRELRGATGSGFSIKAVERWNEKDSDASGGMSMVADTKPLSKEMIDKIMNVKGIKAYNANQYAVLGMYDNDHNIYHNDWSKIPAEYGYPSNVFQGYHCTSTEYSSWFLTRKVALTKGRHITKEDKNAIIISEDLANTLGLKLGDTISATINPENNDPYATYTIVGLFEVLVDEADPKNNLEGNLSNDDLYGGYSYYWFADMNSYATLLQNYADDLANIEKGFNLADFYVTDPQNLEQIIHDVQSIDGIDWDDYELSANDEVFERTGSSMSDISTLIRTLLLIIVAVSTCIVILILSMWVKSRIHETGILLSAGISKRAILMQYMLEILLIAMLAFPLSYLCSNLLAESLGSLFQVTNVTVTIKHFIFVCKYGVLLLLFAILISGIPVFHLKPKDILSKMG